MRMTEGLLLALSMAAAIAVPAAGQQKPATFTFEVISVKPNHSEDMRFTRAQFVGGRFSAANLPLVFLIGDAYQVSFQSMRVIGLPDWVGRERFDIDAKASDDVLPADLATSQRKERTRALLQSLLEERFKMASHRESREMSYYALVAAKNGPKLEKAGVEEKDCVEDPTGDQVPCHRFNGGQGRGLHGKAVSMKDLVGFVENWTDHPVLDKSGIEGLFSIDTDGWVPMRQPPPPAPPPGTPAAPTTVTVGPPTGEGNMLDPTRPTLFMVLQKLGLELKLQKGPIEVFVIDHLERPTPN